MKTSDTFKARQLERLHAAASVRRGRCLSDAYEGAKAPHRFRCAAGHEWDAPAQRIFKGYWCRTCANEAKATAYLRADGLQRLQRVASERGGRCLSPGYLGGRAHHDFQCHAGHVWSARATLVLRGTWCAVCAVDRIAQSKRDPVGLERLRALARERGGECLSTEYVGSHGRYEFRCAKGHGWLSTASIVHSGKWCLSCAHDARRLTIEHMRQAAHERGGRCLSDRYVNVSTKIRWECHKGHTWESAYNNIRQGHWCPACASLNRVSRRASTSRWRYSTHSSELY
ncbi:hypothetical protein [Ideonella sp. BN130291]|uniref:hypothetical protein n=1 Tax=Ideonella sp. BN130291 TaxID=3112940 RepID=UPI002E26FB84|nr:hypothetical protein [Ideonella sp. BN130291]